MRQRYLHRMGIAILIILLEQGHGESQNHVIPVQRPDKYFVYGNVVSPEHGHPVAGAQVVCYGQEGAEKHLETDAEGWFQLELTEVYGWSTTLIARHKGRVSTPLRITAEALKGCELMLAEPSSLEGAVTSAAGQPLSDTDIRIVSRQRRDITLGSTSTDNAGQYRITRLPPDDYEVLVEHSTHQLPREPDLAFAPGVSLRPGETGKLELVLVEKAHVSGAVFEPHGASVAGLEFRVGNGAWHDPFTYARTDQNGRFSTYVTASSYARSVFLRDEEFGNATLKLPALEPGQRMEGIEVWLPGTARFTGTITGVKGKPVAGVAIEGALSDATGRFDTGWISLSTRNGPLSLSVEPPGWRIAAHEPSVLDAHALEGEKNVQYARKSVPVTAHHGNTYRLDIPLDAMPEWQLDGTVTDAEGKTVSGAEILIYQGFAMTEHWMSDFAQRLPVGPEPRLKNWQVQGPRTNALLLARTYSDKRGLWRATILPRDIRDPCLGTVTSSRHELTIVAADSARKNTGVMHATFTSSDEAFPSLNIALQPVAPESVLRARVVDEAGAPIGDVHWVLNCDFGAISSDSSGWLAVPRISPAINLALEGEDRCIIGVEVVGTIEAPPPAHDDPREWYHDDYQRTRCPPLTGMGYDPLTTEVEFDARSVNMPFYDGKQGYVIIRIGGRDA